MRFNEMPQERGQHEKKPGIIRQEDYRGKNFYRVNYEGRSADVQCQDTTAAMMLAAKAWGLQWTRAEYHQAAKVVKLRVDPGMVL